MRSKRGGDCHYDHDGGVDTEDADQEAQNQALNPRLCDPIYTSDCETTPKRSSYTDSAALMLVLPLKFDEITEIEGGFTTKGRKRKRKLERNLNWEAK